ncbi:MAG: nucleoside-diphosphate sugar epimerase/dehydratase, partial [Bryobacteraceae bacterium]
MAATGTTRRVLPVAEIPLHEAVAPARQRARGLRGIPGGYWVQIAYGLTDIALVFVNGMVAFAARFFAAPAAGAAAHAEWGALGLPPEPYAGFLLLYAGLTVLCCQGQDLYRMVRTRTTSEESFAVAKAVALATLLLTTFVFLSGVRSVSRLVVGATGVLNLATFIAWRLWRRHTVRQRVLAGVSARNVLIVGAGRVGKALASYLGRNQQLGYIVKGFLDEHSNGDHRLLGHIEDLPRIAQAHFVDEVFITIPQHRVLVKRVAVEARKQHLNVSVV